MRSTRWPPGRGAPGERYIITVPRQGYKFASEVAPVERRGTDEELAALLEPRCDGPAVFMDELCASAANCPELAIVTR